MEGESGRAWKERPSVRLVARKLRKQACACAENSGREPWAQTWKPAVPFKTRAEVGLRMLCTL